MNQRNAFLIATAVTAFALVLVGAVASRAAVLNAAPAPQDTPAPTADPSATFDPTAQAQIDEREAAYRALIDQANQELQQAYALLEAASGRQATGTPASPSTTADPASSGHAVSVDRATSIALAAVPGAKLTRWPELVLFQGVTAYEVTLDRGVLYVDANTGQVLHNGVAASATQLSSGAAITQDQAIQIAAAYAGQDRVREVELEKEHGILVYEVKFESGAKVYVDASSGQVVYAELRGDSSGRDDHHDEDEDDD